MKNFFSSSPDILPIPHTPLSLSLIVYQHQENFLTLVEFEISVIWIERVSEGKRKKKNKNQKIFPNKFFNKSYQANALWVGHIRMRKEKCHKMRLSFFVLSHFTKILLIVFFFYFSVSFHLQWLFHHHYTRTVQWDMIIIVNEFRIYYFSNCPH